MTDGERLVWASSYALAIERGSDSAAAVRAATLVVTQLREVVARRTADGAYAISQIDERDFVDEMINSP